MLSPSTCLHCRRMLDNLDMAAGCSVCGQAAAAADTPDLRGQRMRGGMKARRDYDEDDEDEDDDDYDDRPSRRGRRSRSKERPGKVQAIAIMTLVGGIVAALNAALILGYLGMMGVATLGFGLVCCLWPGPYYGLTAGILAIIKGSRLLGERGRYQPPPKGTAILLIVNIINFDFINLVLGIIILVFLSEPEVESWYKG